MKIITVLLTISSLLVSLASFASQAEVAVVVHPSNSVQLDEKEISKIYLGKLKSFPSGESAEPLVQENSVADEFNRAVLNRNSSQFKAYWAKRAFSGKGTPPAAESSDADVINVVATTPNAIGYVDAASVNDSVRVILIK